MEGGRGGLWKGFVLISRPFIHEALVAARQHAASEPLTRLDGSLREYGIIDVCSFCVFPTTRQLSGVFGYCWICRKDHKVVKPDGISTQLNNTAVIYILISMF